MAKEKGSFKEFLSAVAPEYQAFVKKLDNKLMEQGCELVIKEAKSGYTASYRLEKKTVMNWYFASRVFWHGFMATMRADMKISSLPCLPICRRK